MTNLQTLADAAFLADQAAKAAKAAADDRRAELVAAMAAAGEGKIQGNLATASLVAGRRTVSITCKALAAEIKAMQERAVRTGRAVARIGNQSVRFKANQ